MTQAERSRAAARVGHQGLLPRLGPQRRRLRAARQDGARLGRDVRPLPDDRAADAAPHPDSLRRRRGPRPQQRRRRRHLPAQHRPRLHPQRGARRARRRRLRPRRSRRPASTGRSRPVSPSRATSAGAAPTRASARRPSSSPRLGARRGARLSGRRASSPVPSTTSPTAARRAAATRATRSSTKTTLRPSTCPATARRPRPARDRSWCRSAAGTGQKMHGNKYLLTDVLKGELGFSGFVVSDWAGIDQLPGDYACDVEIAINAGIDMVMVPERYPEFIATLKSLVQSGRVPQSRIDDAVRRILNRKVALGLWEKPERRPRAPRRGRLRRAPPGRARRRPPVARPAEERRPRAAALEDDARASTSPAATPTTSATSAAAGRSAGRARAATSRPAARRSCRRSAQRGRRRERRRTPSTARARRAPTSASS